MYFYAVVFTTDRFFIKRQIKFTVDVKSTFTILRYLPQLFCAKVNRYPDLCSGTFSEKMDLGS